MYHTHTFFSRVKEVIGARNVILTLLDIRYFLVDGLDMGRSLSGTFMSSNDLVTHQAHKNGQFIFLEA